MLYDQLPKPDFLGSVPERLSLFNKATRVCDYLGAHSLIGTVGDGRPYFCGSVTMNWGGIHEYAAGIVFFGGESADNLIALVGSVNSIVGNRRPSVPSGHAMDYYLFKFFSAIDERPKPSWFRLNAEPPTAVEHSDLEYYRGIESFNHFMTRVPHGPQRMEFVARTLVSHNEDGRLLVIGSPIYVALCDAAQ